MPTADSFVAIPGFREWVRDLGRVSKDLPKAVQRANKEVATDVADATKARARSQSRQYAKAADAIRPRARNRSASIALLVGRRPWILGAELGAKQYRQFPAWTGNQWQAGVGPAAGVGYALHPTIREKTPEIVDTYGDRVERHIAEAWTS